MSINKTTNDIEKSEYKWATGPFHAAPPLGKSSIPPGKMTDPSFLMSALFTSACAPSEDGLCTDYEDGCPENCHPCCDSIYRSINPFTLGYTTEGDPGCAHSDVTTERDKEGISTTPYLSQYLPTDRIPQGSVFDDKDKADRWLSNFGLQPPRRREWRDIVKDYLGKSTSAGTLPLGSHFEAATDAASTDTHDEICESVNGAGVIPPSPSLPCQNHTAGKDGALTDDNNEDVMVDLLLSMWRHGLTNSSCSTSVPNGETLEVSSGLGASGDQRCTSLHERDQTPPNYIVGEITSTRPRDGTSLPLRGDKHNASPPDKERPCSVMEESGNITAKPHASAAMNASASDPTSFQNILLSHLKRTVELLEGCSHGPLGTHTQSNSTAPNVPQQTTTSRERDEFPAVSTELMEKLNLNSTALPSFNSSKDDFVDQFLHPNKGGESAYGRPLSDCDSRRKVDPDATLLHPLESSKNECRERCETSSTKVSRSMKPSAASAPGPLSTAYPPNGFDYNESYNVASGSRKPFNNEREFPGLSGKETCGSCDTFVVSPPISPKRSRSSRLRRYTPQRSLSDSSDLVSIEKPMTTNQSRYHYQDLQVRLQNYQKDKTTERKSYQGRIMAPSQANDSVPCNSVDSYVNAVEKPVEEERGFRRRGVYSSPSRQYTDRIASPVVRRAPVAVRNVTSARTLRQPKEALLPLPSTSSRYISPIPHEVQALRSTGDSNMLTSAQQEQLANLLVRSPLCKRRHNLEKKSMDDFPEKEGGLHITMPWSSTGGTGILSPSLRQAEVNSSKSSIRNNYRPNRRSSCPLVEQVEVCHTNNDAEESLGHHLNTRECSDICRGGLSARGTSNCKSLTLVSKVQSEEVLEAWRKVTSPLHREESYKKNTELNSPRSPRSRCLTNTFNRAGGGASPHSPKRSSRERRRGILNHGTRLRHASARAVSGLDETRRDSGERAGPSTRKSSGSPYGKRYGIFTCSMDIGGMSTAEGIRHLSNRGRSSPNLRRFGILRSISLGPISIER